MPVSATEAESAITRSKLRLFGIGLICAQISLVPLVFDASADWPFTVPKALLTHAIAYVLAGVSAGVLIRFGRDAYVRSILHVPVLAFLAANVAATIFAQDRLLALYGTHTRMLGLGTIASWTVLYFSAVTLIRTRRDVLALIAAGLTATVLMLGYELIQLLGRDPFRWNSDTAVRPFSTNGQATSLAAYFTALAVSAFAATLAVRDVPRWTRVATLLLAGALLVGASATGTRSALIGLAAGSAVLVVLIWFKHPSRRARFVSVAAAGIAALGLVALLLLTPIGGRLLQLGPVPGASEEDNLGRLDLASLDVRAVLYQVAVDVVRERPVLGYGPDNFVVGMSLHRPERGPDEARLTYATSAHSWVAQTATGSGLIGLAAFTAIIGGIAWLTARSAFHAVPVAVASGLAAQLGTGLTSVNDVGSDWVVWVGAALIVVSAERFTHDATPSPLAKRSQRRKAGRTVRDGSRTRMVSAVLCTTVGIGLALTSVKALDASRSSRLSEDARLFGGAAQAVDAGLAATSADPGRSDYWHRLGLAYVNVARWRDAAAAFDRAVQLAPWDLRNIQDLVQTQLVLARDGDAVARARAEQLVNEAVRRDPNYPDAQYTRAVVMQFIGNPVEGVRSIERALALKPGTTNAQWYVTATQLYVSARRAADGVQVARDGLLITGSQRVRIELARALLADGNARDALVAVDGVLAAEPGNADAQRLRAEILAVTPK